MISAARSATLTTNLVRLSAVKPYTLSLLSELMNLSSPNRTSIRASYRNRTLSAFLSDRISRSSLLPLFQFLIAVCYLLVLPFMGKSNIAVISLILLSSVFRGAAFPITNALVSDLVTEDRRGEAYSLLYLVTNI